MTKFTRIVHDFEKDCMMSVNIRGLVNKAKNEAKKYSFKLKEC